MEPAEIEALKQKILENLAAPEEVQTDSGRVKNQSLTQQIAALEYLKKQKAELDAGGSTARRVGLYKLNNRD